MFEKKYYILKDGEPLEVTSIDYQVWYEEVGKYIVIGPHYFQNRTYKVVTEFEGENRDYNISNGKIRVFITMLIPFSVENKVGFHPRRVSRRGHGGIQ